jgi:hypothetical protein
MLRLRDVIAILLAVCLIRLERQDEKEFHAAFHLAFYTHAKIHTPFDVDGDGIVEALAIVTGEKSTRKLEILDLKPLHGRNVDASAAPFRPKTMLEAKINARKKAGEDDVVPLRIATGQIMILRGAGDSSKDSTPSAPNLATAADFTDRTRHYFCGNDWHDASQKCLQPCPGGTPGECLGDEKCYADTPCDALAKPKSPTTLEESEYQLTPAGGLPSVVTLWSDGTVMMHSVTYKVGESKKLELREMWNSTLTLGNDKYDVLLLGDQDFSSGKDGAGQHGIVLLAGTSTPNSIVYALDAMSGELVWSTNSSETSKVNSFNNATSRGRQSLSRRRSRLLEAGVSREMALPNCWNVYKHRLSQHLKVFWTQSDARWYALHLDRQVLGKKKKSKRGKNWHRRYAIAPIHGRPNSLMQRHEGGVQIRSIKNGRPICHLSLSNRIYYADLNNDGTLDQVQAVTGSEHQNAEAMEKLSHQLDSNTEKGQRDIPLTFSNSLCHLIVLSGLPAREELFTANLCSGKTGDYELSSAPPLLTPDGQIIVALSNGRVSSHNTLSGKQVWEHNGNKVSPTWHPISNSAMVASLYPPHPLSPVIITGENGMAIFSSTRGTFLATTTYPQGTLQRPLLEDWSGDGIPDILIATPDAVWGYRVLLRSTGAWSRIGVGILFLILLLALLRNRAVSHNGRDKRSTEK